MSTKSEKKTALTIILAAALSISELLAIIPGVKSNSIFQLVSTLIESVAHLADDPCAKNPSDCEAKPLPEPTTKIQIEDKRGK